jgi:Ca2+-binding EF-hand superfamily protein
MNPSRHLWIALLTLGTGFSLEPPKGEDPPPVRPRGEGAGKAQRGGKDRPEGRRMMEMWKKADTDGDGFISLAEFGAMERPRRLPEEKRAEIFKRFDKDGDGRLGPKEIPRRPQGGMPPLEQVDADKDGRIVFEEFVHLGFVTRLPEERRRALFERMDQDGDGALTPKDRPKGGGPPWQGKRDGKGGGHGPQGMDLIRELDKNGDRALDFDEFREAGFLKGKSEDEQEDRFEQMDRNDDLKLDAADFPPPGERKPDAPGQGG